MFPAASPEVSQAPTAPTSRADWFAALVVVTLYSALQVWLALGHDPWLDEAQAWLLASQANSPLDLIVLSGEGHPPLWYWLLWTLSRFLDFSQARFLTLGVAILNAWLLWRVLRGQVVLLALILFSFPILQFWGYHFRPYGLILTCLLSALLLERRGRSVAGTWVMAITCGLHFLSGFLFAFWLLWQWHKGTPIQKLLLPALLGLLFGLCAILSSGNNVTIGMGDDDNPWLLTLSNLGWIGMVEPLRSPLVAGATLIALGYGLRQRPFIAVSLITLLIVFAASTALVYGRTPWHSAFLTTLCFMAFFLAGFSRQRAWIMAILMLPQVAFGAAAVQQRLVHPVWGQDDLLALIRADAGNGMVPERDIVGWPSVVIPPYSAIHGIAMINGNDGTIIGPIDWSKYQPEQVDPLVADKPAPYWLICAACEIPLAGIRANQRSATLLGSKYMLDHVSSFQAYRID